jgi:MSHA biogenesis protein MshP
MQGVRAYQAARAGLEWGIYRAIIPAAPGTCSPTATLPTLAGDLAPFTVTVTCVSTAVAEGANTVTLYDISSTATLGTAVGSANYVERRLNATVER